MSLIEEEPARKVRMAHLAIVGTHSTNGVAEIHSELLKTTVVPDFAELFPERFSNKTNGVTPRRWLLLANPPLARLITEAIGDGWITDLAQLRKLLPLAEDAGLPRRVPPGQARGQGAVCRLAEDHDSARWSIPTAIFDCQIKRIHEYKRQLLNVLHIIVLYNRLRAEPAARRAAADVLLRGQGGAGLSPGQAHHQAHQQCRRR